MLTNKNRAEGEDKKNQRKKGKRKKRSRKKTKERRKKGERKERKERKEKKEGERVAITFLGGQALVSKQRFSGVGRACEILKHLIFV